MRPLRPHFAIIETMSEQAATQSTYQTLPIDDTLELRAVPRKEAQTMFDLTVDNRPYLARYLPWADETKTVDDSLAFIEATESKRANGEEYGFGIVLEGQIVGHISIMHLKDGKMPEIGYWIAEPVSGSGITTKAAKALTHFGLETLGLDTILIRAVPENIASNKIAENLGYKLEGVELDEKGLPHNHWVLRKSQIKEQN